MKVPDIFRICSTFTIAFFVKLVVCSVDNLFELITSHSYDTNRCINNITKNNFLCGTLTNFINPDRAENTIMKNANDGNICHSIIVHSFDTDVSNWYIHTDVYIITATDLLDLSSGLQVLTRNIFWNPRAKFIFQVEKLYNEKHIQQIFKLFSKHNIYNVILLSVLQNDALIYTYYPFKNANCDNYIETIFLGSCENIENILEFPENNLNDLINCNVKVVATDDVPNFISKSSNYTVYGKFVPGLEQFVLDTIAAKERFTIEYQVFYEDEMSDGVVLPNRTSTGLLNYLETGRADVAAGGYSLIKNRVDLFEYLYGFNYASYNLFTPVMKGIAWKRLYREFSLFTWLLIGSAFLVVSMVCLLLKWLLKDNTGSILNTWGYFFSNSNVGVSKNPRFRNIIFFWSWFTFFVVNFYNTALFSLITIHVHETQHSISANNLKTLPYKPCISDNTRMFYQFAYNQTLPKGEPIHNCTFTDGALQYVATTKKYYAIEMEYSYTLKEYDYLDQEGKHDLEPWGFSGSNVIVMYIDRGSRYRNIFQKYATRMFESGLLKNQLKTIHLRSYNVIKRHPKAFQEVTMSDLGLHFCILLVGYLLSIICFILEIWHHNLPQKKKSKKSISK